MPELKSPFARLLLKWNDEHNNREMPWKGEKDPYLVWLSEIIMQQTRVEQGLPYFKAFKEKYPTVKHLALAAEDEVMRLWQGLGYYSRARNLHATAKNIHINYKGVFPSGFDSIRQLKGVGDYTASAIASFVFGEKRAVVDGNVIRVLARVFGVDEPFDTTAGRKKFNLLAQQLIDDKRPGVYNQAIMDFGALVCSPQNPKCAQCPFGKICVAYKGSLVNELPVRKNKTKTLNRYFNFLVIRDKKHILIQKRTGNDIWKNLYQLPLIETPQPVKKDFRSEIAAVLRTDAFAVKSYSEDFTQLLTHRKIHARFIEIDVKKLSDIHIEGAQRVPVSDLQHLAFPKTVHLYLMQNSLL